MERSSKRRRLGKPGRRRQLGRNRGLKTGSEFGEGTYKHATVLFLGVYNFVRKHKTLGTTPAVAAGVEFEAWDLERVVEMTAEYCRRKEDAKFEEAFAELES